MPRNGKKRWLWLLLIPVGAICLPLLLFIAMMVGSEMMGALIGPVNIFNSTTHIPAEADIAGHYQLSKKDSRDSENESGPVSEDSGFTLRPDHELEVRDLPDFGGFGGPPLCSYNGTGKWRLDENSASVMLNMDITTVLPAKSGGLPSCKPANFGSFAVLGRSKPYHFWWYIGDPDSDEGLVYKLR